MINLKDLDYNFSKGDSELVRDIITQGKLHEKKTVEEFCLSVESVWEKFEKIASENDRIKAYLRLWKGDARKLYLEIIPFKCFLRGINLPRDCMVKMSNDLTSYDAILFFGTKEYKIEIVTAYVDEQEIYRTHHLNKEGSVGVNQTYCKKSDGDLIEDSNLGALESTPGKDSEALRIVLCRMEKAILKKQRKKYVDTQLLVVLGKNGVFYDNTYGIYRVKETIEQVNDGTFDDIHVLDYNIEEIVSLKGFHGN